jgi:ferrous iron transport protein B
MSAVSPASPPARPPARTGYVVLTGNPNSGKTTLFNALTGLRAKVGNYAGVTVERKEGRLTDARSGPAVTVLDLPGTYSLSPKSLDEQVARDVLLHRLREVPAPDLVVVVVDASNLERNLYYATQVIELGYPTLIALNMTDVASECGHRIDTARLAELLGAPVAPMVARSGEGVADCRRRILERVRRGDNGAAGGTFTRLPGLFEREIAALAERLRAMFPRRAGAAAAEALLLLTDEKALEDELSPYPRELGPVVNEARRRLEAGGVDWRSAAIEARYARVGEISRAVLVEQRPAQESFSDRLDRVLTHKLWGMVFFVAVMALMFQSIFSFAEIPMNLLEQGVGWIGGQVARLLPEGVLHSLLVDGVIAGVGAVIVFLPQICLLFLFIGFLEDTGYMARAAFLMDRLMSKVGLHGKSFIPMLSSFACAIPGIMATRTIETPKDRLVTILVAPLMSCSARLPVYTVLIAACIPDRTVLGFLGLAGLTMLGMYLLGIVVALTMAWLFKKTLLKGHTPMLIMELPPYRKPVLSVVLRHMWDRAVLFLRRAGTIILGASILLWFLASYPRSAAITEEYAARTAAAQQAAGADATIPNDPGAAAQEKALADQLEALRKEQAGERLRHSFAGRLGRFIEPVIAPLGFDWKIGIGIVASFAAREVFVSTMATVYNVGQMVDDEAGGQTLARTLQAQRRPDGTPVYTTLVGLTLMVFYVLALQCVSTVAIVRRETNSWKWPLFQWAYMGVLAWVLAFLTYQGGRLLRLA